MAKNKANIIADVAVSRALPAATSLRRRQAAAADVRVGVCVRQRLQCAAARSTRCVVSFSDVLCLASLRVLLLRCSALRGSFPLSGLAATTKMAALKYLTPLSMLRKYFAKASYNNNNNSEKENGVKFKMIANAEQTKMMMKMKILRGAAEGSSRRCCV